MISGIIPKLPFISRQPTIRFYELLGFHLRSDYSDYLIFDFPPAELHFFSYPTLQPAKSDFMIYLRVISDIETFYHKIQEAGIAIHPNGTLTDKPWKQKEFSIVDPNGTLLTFGQAI
jgi:uncharacterized glyoxalase superfamily protein PhnB